MQSYNVFISYRGNSNGGFLGKELYTDLKHCKSDPTQIPIYPFFAPACIQKGENYQQRIEEALKTASCVILVLSPGYFEKCTENDDMVCYELQQALKNPRITFIPIVMEGFVFQNEISAIEGLFTEDEIYRFKHINAINHHGIYDFNTEADVLPVIRKAIEEGNVKANITKSASNVVFDVANFKCGNGRVVEFGNYPQARIKDQNIIQCIYEGLGTAKTKRCDKVYEYEGKKYYNISSNCFNKQTFKDEVADKSFNFYIFSPIYWIEIFSNDEYSVLITRDIIDAEKFNIDRCFHRIGDEDEYIPPNDWGLSSIRRWLNNDFYYEAFNEIERGTIQNAKISNSSESCYHKFSKERPQTMDSVFLISHEEIYTAKTGLEDVGVAKVTDYAKAKGAYSSTSATSDGYGDWWTRSPGNIDTSVENVDRRGCLDAFPFCNYVNDTAAGVRPCIIVEKKGLKYVN